MEAQNYGKPITLLGDGGSQACYYEIERLLCQASIRVSRVKKLNLVIFCSITNLFISIFLIIAI